MAKHKAKTSKKNIILILFLFVIVSASFIAVFGRYITNNIKDSYFASKQFYFYSDKLTLAGAKYRLENWSGVDDYNITINLNSMENNLKKVNYDIEYDVNCTYSDNIICELTKQTGTIYGTNNSDYFNIIITPNTTLKDGDKVQIDVTATSKGPYIKTLTAQFIITIGKEMLSYEIEDSANSPYLELNMTNTLTYYLVDEAFDIYQIGDKITSDIYYNLPDTEKQKCHSTQVTLEFDPTQVLLDMTSYSYLNSLNVKNKTVNGNTYIYQITFNIDAVSSRKVRFYKQDVTKDYSYPQVQQQSIIKVTNR